MRLSVSCHSRHTPRSSMVTSLSDCTLEREREGATVCDHCTHRHTLHAASTLPYIHTTYSLQSPNDLLHVIKVTRYMIVSTAV